MKRTSLRAHSVAYKNRKVNGRPELSSHIQHLRVERGRGTDKNAISRSYCTAVAVRERATRFGDNQARDEFGKSVFGEQKNAVAATAGDLATIDRGRVDDMLDATDVFQCVRCTVRRRFIAPVWRLFEVE